MALKILKIIIEKSIVIRISIMKLTENEWALLNSNIVSSMILKRRNAIIWFMIFLDPPNFH